MYSHSSFLNQSCILLPLIPVLLEVLECINFHVPFGQADYLKKKTYNLLSWQWMLL